MKTNWLANIILRSLICSIIILHGTKLNAQNCTVNAGIDGQRCIQYSSGFQVSPLLLSGNSAGNISNTPNLLWEIASSPLGSNITLSTPNNNSTYVNGDAVDAPSGVYIFRLGMNCLSGERIYDSVIYSINNIADFNLYADKPWNVCANVQTFVNLVGRPLKTGEVLRLNGRGIELTYSNFNALLYTDIYGPTTDSVRFTITNKNYNTCTFEYYPLFNYKIRSVQYCSSENKDPIINGIPSPLGYSKAAVRKTGTRNIDTIACINIGSTFLSYANNICLVGGRNDITEYSGNFTTRTLSGSGIISSTILGATSIYNIIQNQWDTVTANTWHNYELNYNSNGCYASFKDTVKVFFKSFSPSPTNFTFNSGVSYCLEPSAFPLTSFKFPLVTTGIVPPNYTFNSTIIAPSGASFSITNSTSKDSLEIVGSTIIAGNYTIKTLITDTITLCSKPITSYFTISKKAILPVLRDTTICPASLIGNTFTMPYKAASFGLPNLQYTAYTITGININYLYPTILNDSTISVQVNTTIPGNYDVVVLPFNNGCSDGRRDTFRVSLISSGYVSNAGTDQMLLCNVNSTSLAGSLPSSTGGNAGFWKFLPAISSNIGSPVVIGDSTNRNTVVSGFSNLSSYYFSWNVTGGNSNTYCALKPDTVLIIFSGVPPSIPQSAQPNYSGCLAANGIYQLHSNAITPTFNAQWNKVSGVGGTIVNPNNQNTYVSGLSIGNYVYELVVTNACGIFKDTVHLNFGCALPVKLISFHGYKNSVGNDILSWDISEEINMKHYELELSADANKFTTLGIVSVSNNTATNKKYDYTNSTIFNPTNFYRLKMVDIDGSYSYSNIIKIRSAKMDNAEIEISPNPAQSNLLVHITSLETKASTIEIIDCLGQVTLKKHLKLYKGVNNTAIDVSTLKRGVYFIRENNSTKKLILQ
jgi:hypothetical protein